MKKWLTFILLLITTAGTIIPCCGADDCCADQSAKPANHENCRDEGACSPFFACAGCPGSVELAKPIQLVQLIVEKPVHHQKILKSDLSTYTASFWQPPRSC